MTKKGENTSEGHRKRLREKFLESGLSGFHDYEVIELLLTIGTPRKDCKEVAKRCMAEFQTLQNVFEASTADLLEIKGIGPKNIFGLKLIKEVCDRYLEKKVIDTDVISNAQDLLAYLSLALTDKDRECFKVIYLNAKNRVISSEILFEGTLTSSAIYPREVVKAAIRNNAAALIFAHNHPSGDPAPSPEDLMITRKLIFACRVMDITVHEHIIVGHDRHFSFADSGLIEKFDKEYERQ